MTHHRLPHHFSHVSLVSDLGFTHHPSKRRAIFQVEQVVNKPRDLISPLDVCAMPTLLLAASVLYALRESSV